MRDYIHKNIIAAYVTDADAVRVTADIVDHSGASLLGEARPVAPTITGTIQDRVYKVGSGPYTIDLATKFSGAASYMVTPMPAGASLTGSVMTIAPFSAMAQTAITVRGIGRGGLSVAITFNLTVEAATNPAEPVVQIPETITAPQIAPGPHGLGAEVTGLAGVYSNDPTSIARRWSIRDSTSETWSEIAGVNGLSVSATALMAGHDRIMMQERPENAAGPARWVDSNIAVLDVKTGAEPEPRAPTHGYLADRDEGTTWDKVVAPNGSDSNPGTLDAPYETIQKALEEVRAGGTVRVRGGLYRQQFAITKDGPTIEQRTTVARYGNEEVIISGAKMTSGWQQCVQSDEDFVGSNWQQVFKKEFNLTDFVESDPRSANPYANNKRLRWANGKLPTQNRPDFDTNISDWQMADDFSTGSVDVDGKLESDIITGIKHTAFTDNYTEAQINNCEAGYYRADNWTSQRKVTLDPTTKYMMLEKPRVKISTGTSFIKFGKLYSLFNLIANIQRGQWGYRKEVNGRVWLYIYPHEPADMTSVEISRYGYGANLTRRNNVEIRGLIFEKQAGAGGEAGIQYAVVAKNSAGQSRSNVVVDSVTIRNTLFAGMDGYSPITISYVDGFNARNFTIDTAIGQLGVSLLGGGAGSRVDRFVMNRVEKGPFRVYGVTNSLFARGTIANSNCNAHTNKTAVYLGSEQNVFWAIDFSGVGGYFTWQQSSGTTIGFCSIPANYAGEDSRCIVDQNHGDKTDGPLSPASARGQDQIGYIINNSLPPFNKALDKRNSVILGSGGNGIFSEVNSKYDFHNNLTYGVSIKGPENRIDGSNGNIEMFATAGVGQTALSSIYTDYERGDLSIRADSPTWNQAGRDLTVIVNDLKSRFQDFDGFETDLAGNPYNPANPPVGPYARPNTTVAEPPAWIKAPIIAGTPKVGTELSIHGGYRTGYPYPKRTQQWLRSADEGKTWTAITGATGEAYTPVAGDVDNVIGVDFGDGMRVVTAGKVSAAGSYSIRKPVSVMRDQISRGTGAALAFDTKPFTSTGKPLLIIAPVRMKSDVSVDATITVGTPNRLEDLDPGVEMTWTSPPIRRGTNNVVVAYILNPPVGQLMARLKTTNEAYSHQVQVYEVEGLVGKGEESLPKVATAAEITDLKVSTKKADSAVLYVVSRAGGDITTNPLIPDGINISELWNGTTGNDLYNDLAVFVGWAEVQTPGTNATPALKVSWTGNRSVAAQAIELQSKL